jgi:hypothetical protein
VKIMILIIVAGLVAIGFSGLRVYGAYHTEKTRAITRAKQALYEASVKEKAARIQTTFETRSNEQRVVQTPSGKLVFAFPADEAIALVNEQMKLGYAAINLKFYAEMESRYSTNRKLQTLAIAHKAWLVLIGATENREEWVNFLTEHETREDVGCAAHAGCKDGYGRPAREIWAYAGPGATVDNNPERVAANDKIVYGTSDDDEFSKRIDVAVDQVEEFFKTRIRG